MILLANIGSASKKYALAFEEAGELRVRVVAHYEASVLPAEAYARAHRIFIDALAGKGYDAKDIDTELVRIVAPGRYFQEHRVIDAEYFVKLVEAEHVAPLHLHAQHEELVRLQEMLPHTQFVGISDTAFHATIPEHVARYAIPRSDADTYGIRKFGYHGLAISSALTRAATLYHSRLSRVIVCHLGGGGSVTAIRDGKSVDTSMGTTPLDGLIMATRVGAVDPGAVLTLMEAKGMSPAEMRAYLNTESGLKGLGGSDDIRELLIREAHGDMIAKEALDAYVYRVRHYSGGAMATLGGVDLLILSGTVSERSATMRSRILSSLHGLGIALDATHNIQHADNQHDALLSTVESTTKIAVVHINEYEAMLDAWQKFEKN